MGRRRRASGSEPRRQARQAFRLGRNLASPEFTSGDRVEIRGPRPAGAGWGRMFAHGFYPARVRMEMRLVFLVLFTKQICSPQKAICQMVQNSCYIKTLYWESLTWISKEWDLPHSTQI